MCFTNIDPQIKDLYEYAVSEGFSEEYFFSTETVENYVDTSVDGYRGYPLFMNVFSGKYDEKLLRRMMLVDFKSRLGVIAGISSSSNYESVILIGPPHMKKTGMLQYVKVANVGDYSLLFKSAMYRQENYEKFAIKKRMPYMDDSTWYIYIYATKKELQRKGYGKKLMNLVISYTQSIGHRICLETDLAENVPMYEKFGFKLMDRSVYKDSLEHFVMLN